MNDEWIAVDLDGTLAEDIPSGKFDPLKIGAPVPLMVQRVREYVDQGFEVRIFTARASIKDHHTIFNGSPAEYRATVVRVIKAWCLEHIGIELEVTCEKDYKMQVLYDDRARQIIRNKGVQVGCDECRE